MSAHQTFFALVTDNFSDQKVIEISFDKADGHEREELKDDKFGYDTATKAIKKQNHETDPFIDEYNERLAKRRTFCRTFLNSLARNEERKKQVLKNTLSLCVEYLKEKFPVEQKIDEHMDLSKPVSQNRMIRNVNFSKPVDQNRTMNCFMERKDIIEEDSSK